MSEPTPVEPVAEPTPVQPEPMQYLTDDGKFTEQFRSSLPDDLGKHSVFDKYGDFTELVKGTINTQKLVGKKAEEFWTSEDPNDIARRMEIMGVPKDAKDYNLEVGELPEGMPFDAERIDAFKEKALELGLTAKQAEQLIEWDVSGAKEAFASMAEQSQIALTEAENALRTEWKGDKYEYNISKAQEALDYLELGHLKEDPAYGNNPDFIKAVVDKIVPLISNDTLIEARQQESYATVVDQLNELDAKMYAFEGSTQEPAYQNMVKQRGDLLQKVAK